MSGAAAANALTKKVSATKEILIGAGLAIAVGCSLPLLVWGQGAPMRGFPVSCTLGGGFAVLLGLRVFFVAMLCCSRACPPT